MDGHRRPGGLHRHRGLRRRGPRQIEIRDGKASALAPRTSPDEAVIDAADMCPMSAITVRDAASGALLAPEE